MKEAEKYFNKGFGEDIILVHRINVFELMQSFSDEQIKKVLDKLEKELKQSDDFVYPSVYQNINKLKRQIK